MLISKITFARSKFEVAEVTDVVGGQELKVLEYTIDRSQRNVKINECVQVRNNIHSNEIIGIG